MLELEEHDVEMI